MAKKIARRERIKRSIRRRLSGSEVRPRLSVFRSNQHIYAQIINDETGVVLSSASSKQIEGTQEANKISQAEAVGRALAERAVAAGVGLVVFDRNGYLYHGRVKALADAAREGGLQF